MRRARKRGTRAVLRRRENGDGGESEPEVEKSSIPYPSLGVRSRWDCDEWRDGLSGKGNRLLVVAEQDRERKLEAPIEAAIAISWMESAPGKVAAKVSFRTIVWVKWDLLLRALPLKEGAAKNRVTLLKALSNALALQFRDAIDRQGKGVVRQLKGRLDAKAFDEIMERLESAGVVARVDGPKYVRQKSTYWTLTAEGARKVQGLRKEE